MLLCYNIYICNIWYKSLLAKGSADWVRMGLECSATTHMELTKVAKLLFYLLESMRMFVVQWMGWVPWAKGWKGRAHRATESSASAPRGTKCREKGRKGPKWWGKICWGRALEGPTRRDWKVRKETISRQNLMAVPSEFWQSQKISRKTIQIWNLIKQFSEISPKIQLWSQANLFLQSLNLFWFRLCGVSESQKISYGRRAK